MYSLLWAPIFCLIFVPIISIISNMILILTPIHDKSMRHNLHILFAIFGFAQILHSSSLLGFLISAIFQVQQLKQVDCLIIQSIPLVGTALSPFVYLAISFQLLISNINVFRSVVELYSRTFLCILLLPAVAFTVTIFYSIISSYQETASHIITYCAYWSAFGFDSDYYFYISVLICILIALIANLFTAIGACSQQDTFALGLRPGLFYYMYSTTVAYTITVIGRVFREFSFHEDLENIVKLLLEGGALWLTSCLPMFLLYRYCHEYKKAIQKLLGRIHESKSETTLSFSRRRSTFVANES